MLGTGTTSATHTVAFSSAQRGVAIRDARGYELEGFRWNDRRQLEVYYNWDGGPCVLGGLDMSGPASALDAAVTLETLNASIRDINAQLRGALTLVNAGPTTRADLCSTDSGHAIVVGYGRIASTGLARYYGYTTPGSEFARFSAARVYLNNTYNFACPSGVTYRDLQHVMTHELLHAIGVGHSADANAVMAPTAVACNMPSALQPDDVAALAALYPPPVTAAPAPAAAAPVATAPTPAAPSSTPAPSSTSLPTSAGDGFDRAIADAGVNTAIWRGGSVGELTTAARAAGSVSITAFAGGRPVVFVPGAPTFVNASFDGAFPGGLPAGTIVLVVR